MKKCMFTVAFRKKSSPSSLWNTETVIAKDANEATAKATKKAQTLIKAEGSDLFVSDVTFLGAES